MLEGILNNKSMEAMRMAARFTASRHDVIANNIANITTPGYKTRDLSVETFAKALKDADVGRLEKAFEVIRSSDAGVIREDGNNVSIEKEMSKMSQNAMRHNILLSLLDKQFKGIETALRERLL